MKSQRLNNNNKIIREITIKGLVQGIGYRPFIAGLATEIGLSGFVRNTDGVVTVCMSGTRNQVDEFNRRVLLEGPSLAKVTQVLSGDVCEKDEALIRQGVFYIADSNSAESFSIPYIPPDIATCKSCERELFDSENRRFRHAFISCTDCGPRYSIIEALPYDRPRITMSCFEYCEACKNEYISTRDQMPGNRRRHAQTIACKSCGPRLSYWKSGSLLYAKDDEKSLNAAVEALRAGSIVATMDIGGFHLACLATDEKAVAKLRSIKHRQRKPFAVLFESTEQIKQYAAVGDLEQELLESIARPVVLLENNESKTLANGVCVNSPYLGAMLPCNPIQMILSKECGPLVMTSANYSGDLMIIDSDEMKHFSEEANQEIEILYHNRPIITPLDDSVVRVIDGRRQTIRRARGYVPEPVILNKHNGSAQVFAAGGDMKATFGFMAEGKAYLSQPFGDMELEEVQSAYEFEKMRMTNLFGFEPEKTVCDKHPGYFTRKMVEIINHDEVYHHQAHVASVIMEQGLEGEVIGLAFDGTGYGTDGTVHGSEFYHWKQGEMRRFASLNSVKMQGGSEGIRNANTILAAFIDKLPESSGEEKKKTLDQTRKIIDFGMNTVFSSSMGRMFDAVSSLLGICEYSEYEGEAAIELEYAAYKAQKSEKLKIEIFEKDGLLRGNSQGLLESICDKVNQGAKAEELALGFIDAVAEWSIRTINTYCKNNNIETKQIALSGGTFQNALLMHKVTTLAKNEGYKVYTNEQVSPGDGGIALGQMMLAR